MLFRSPASREYAELRFADLSEECAVTNVHRVKSHFVDFVFGSAIVHKVQVVGLYVAAKAELVCNETAAAVLLRP